MRSVGTLTRADLAETINRKMGFSRAESLDMVEAILAKMSDALAKGENVKISGFGSFVLRDKNERIGRNPKTGIEVPITPRRVVSFRASQLLKEQVAKAGLVIASETPNESLVEIVELPASVHPWFMAVQFHPESVLTPQGPELLKAWAEFSASLVR